MEMIKSDLLFLIASSISAISTTVAIAAKCLRVNTTPRDARLAVTVWKERLEY